MTRIKIHDIRPTGAELFDDFESFMNELSTEELDQSIGGAPVGRMGAAPKGRSYCTHYSPNTPIFHTVFNPMPL